MKSNLRLALIAACLALRLAAAEDPGSNAEPVALPPPQPAAPPTADQQKLEAAIRERLAEHTLEKTAKTTPTHAAPVAAATTATAAGNAGTTAPATSTSSPTSDQATLLLPRVEVNKSRITEVMIKEHQKDLEIAQEKKNTTPTALDSALNDSDVSHKLAILGGSSSDDRARVAQERVSLLEAEKDLLDEIARAPTKEEREDLQKQLNDLKTMRRELEREPRDERK